MHSKEFLDWLRLYRHDLMNDLQLVQGYASMGKHDKSKEKLNNLIERLNRERKLQTLNAPEFVRWLLTINLEENHLALSFTVEGDSNESVIFNDIEMKNDGEQLVRKINSYLSEFDQYIVHVIIKHQENWQVIYEWPKQLEQHDSLMEAIHHMTNCQEINQTEEMIQFVFHYR
ncbi:Spo0B domain-containing protein [Alkalibacillus aidingensis]|uniref:Spo0B domain-containing protein n=1 Tax=Alkalibacillus aidingensis TaxID=2747607 RepID=UPI0016610117|nr:Spo0B domain-containing protein [Alkalibacillus aidingensis]